MKFQPGKSGNPAGRKKGSPNKMTKNLKSAYVEAFERLGGVDGLVEWAAAHKDIFYGQVSKMLPRDLELKSQQDLEIRVISAIPEPLPLEAIDLKPPQLPGPDEK